jgi:hypothetical protein
MDTRKLRLWRTATLCLVACAALSAENSQRSGPSGALPAIGAASLVPVTRLEVSGVLNATSVRTSIVQDGTHVYLNLPNSVLRGTAPLGPASNLQPIFTPASGAVTRLYEYDHALYVLARPRGGSEDHTLFQSADGGNTFSPVDAGLLKCASSCTYLESTQLLARNGLLYVNAGGGRNVLVSENQGASYSALSGEVGEAADIECYSGTFALIGRTAVLGGECGLDPPYLERGVLSTNGLAVARAFQPVSAPSLVYRKVSVIANDPGTPLVLAGADGSLLRSTDDGVSFQYAIKHFVGQSTYPYIGHILFPTVRSDIVLIAGFDRISFRPYLAYGTRDGGTWTDISGLFANMPHSAITGLGEESTGRLLVAVAGDTVGRGGIPAWISIYEVRIGR